MIRTSKGLLKVFVNDIEIKLNINRKPTFKKDDIEIKDRYLITWEQKLRLNDIVKIEFYPMIDVNFLEFNSDEYEQYICYENRSQGFAMTLGLDVNQNIDEFEALNTERFDEFNSRMTLRLYNHEILKQVEHGLGLAWIDYQSVNEVQYSRILARIDFASEPNRMLEE